MNFFYNLYAFLLSLIGVYLFMTQDYIGSPRSGRILSAIVIFLIICIFADKIVSQQYADVFLKFFCCIVLTVLVIVLF